MQACSRIARVHVQSSFGWALKHLDEAGKRAVRWAGARASACTQGSLGIKFSNSAATESDVSSESALVVQRWFQR